MMTDPLKLMCVLAHPDDESLGFGGILCRYADEGVGTYLVTATRGERGWFGPEDEYPGPEALGRIREEELCAAAEVLGLREVNFLGYEDGLLDQADPQEAIAHIVGHVRRVRPHVVCTFDPSGAYGHPDHIAICQFATAAIVAAADPAYEAPGDHPPHRVSKLYYMAETDENAAAYESAFGELVMHVDGDVRRIVSWQPWAVTTRVDTAAYWQQVWEAIACHRSQLPGYEALRELPEEQRRNLWSTQSLYRAFSLVNGGRQVERDLFAGLRPERDGQP
ncbi:MAG: PIG-L family deacetylase [Candidatus Promineifilaceae bacterium]|nr:PIG-L family deacetylase [Candidatus Promineifilaceae bacterium]